MKRAAARSARALIRAVAWIVACGLTGGVALVILMAIATSSVGPPTSYFGAGVIFGELFLLFVVIPVALTDEY